MARRFLLLGASGQLGRELHACLAPLGSVLTPPRSEVDLSRPETLAGAIRRFEPEVIVNAAADTAVEEAETPEGERHAWLVNGVAPGVLAEEARRSGALVVHYSTDYVFDGEARVPYAEDAPPGPLNNYGRSKLEGERRVREGTDRHLLFRIAWVYSDSGRNFFLAIARQLRRNGVVRVVTDQTGAPTWARAVAEATATILAREPGAAASGTYHLPSGGSTTWHRFADAILEHLRRSGNLREGRNVPVTTAELGARVRRPAYSILDGSKVLRTFGVRLPEWEAQFSRFLEGLDPAVLERL